MRPLPEYAFTRRENTRVPSKRLLLPGMETRAQPSGKSDSYFRDGIKMNSILHKIAAVLPLGLPVLLAGVFVQSGFAQAVTEIGGQKIVTITRKAFSNSKPEFTSVTVLPGRGMELLQITANFPGKGSVDVLASPDLAASKKMLDQDDNANGDLAYRLGSAFLVPYPNRIRGKLSADGKTLTTEWQGHTITLPANNIGKNPGAERHAMHGLILKAKTDNVSVKNISGGQEVTGVIHAGDFGGHWLSKTDLSFTIRLTADAVDTIVVAKNVGAEPEPIAIGWHPYFNLPSGDRTQVRIHIPASQHGRSRRLRQRLPHRQDQARRRNPVRPSRLRRRPARKELL